MTKSRLKQLIAESLAEVHQKQIDEFLAEFANFNVKQEKERLKSLHRQLQELQRHANIELYEKNSKYIYTRRFFKLKETIKNIQSKIKNTKKIKILLIHWLEHTKTMCCTNMES